MQATSLGHAGVLLRSGDTTITCDPWFVPAFFASWFVFPRNDQLTPELMHEVCNPDFLYISHLHGDHCDLEFLSQHMSKDTTILLPGFPTREMERELSRIGFRNFIRTIDGVATEISPGVSATIFVETSITDGPSGDSALLVSDESAQVLNQNDCRISDLSSWQSGRKVDLHWLQYSGAIWYPMVYDIDATEKKKLAQSKVESQFSRAIKYVEAVDARVIVPSAGPPCFLDPDLFDLNMVTGDETSIFPDQVQFIARLTALGRDNAQLNIPGTTFTVSNGEMTTTHPVPIADVHDIFNDKASYLRAYQSDWSSWLADRKATWASTPRTDLLKSLQVWWQPLLAMATTVRTGIGANCLLHLGDEAILINFPEGRIEQYTDHPFGFRFDIARDLVEIVVANKAIDWSNSLFLSCRFTAWRDGAYNEYLYNFFKSLSVERMTRTEAEASRNINGVDAPEADITLGDYIVQRRCPHRSADLSVFGEIDGDQLVCNLHGWRFNLETGVCTTSPDKRISVRKRS